MKKPLVLMQGLSGLLYCFGDSNLLPFTTQHPQPPQVS